MWVVSMDNKIYSLYKRIMKRYPKAIDEIESIDEAKAIIKMMTGNVYLNGEIYQMEQKYMSELRKETMLVQTPTLKNSSN